ncbi:MAG: YihY/virulence factor BrkB family protein, partial [Microbacterium sp.]
MNVARIIAWALARTPVRAVLRYSESRGPMLADSVTYRALFSIFAGVLLGFSVAALWLAGDPQAWGALVEAVDRTVPGLVGEGGLIDVD